MAPKATKVSMFWRLDPLQVLLKIALRQGHVLDNQRKIFKELRAMAKVTEEIRAFSAQIDTATNRISAGVTAVADRIQKLIDSVDSPLPDEAKTILGDDVIALNAAADALELVGKDPANPTPTP